MLNFSRKKKTKQKKTDFGKKKTASKTSSSKIWEIGGDLGSKFSDYQHKYELILLE